MEYIGIPYLAAWKGRFTESVATPELTHELRVPSILRSTDHRYTPTQHCAAPTIGTQKLHTNPVSIP